MTTGRKLTIGMVIVAGVTAYMAYLGAAASWQYYLTVDECLANRSSLGEARIRVGGRIAANSLCISAERRQATFSLVGTAGDLPVTCCGPLPDNLAENREVMVEGRLESSGMLRVEKVLTRCSSKYNARIPSGTSETAARAAAEKVR